MGWPYEMEAALPFVPEVDNEQKSDHSWGQKKHIETTRYPPPGVHKHGIRRCDVAAGFDLVSKRVDAQYSLPQQK